MVKQLNANCTECKLHRGVDPDQVCLKGRGNKRAPIMVVSKMRNSKGYQRTIEEALVAAGVDIADVYWAEALKCRDYDQSSGRAQVKACKHYLDDEITKVNPEWILAFGNEALLAVTGRSGITKYRTKVMRRKDGRKVIATVSPAVITRNPGQRASWYSDVNFFGAQVRGKVGSLEMPEVMYVTTKEKFYKLRKILTKTKRLSYDVETTATATEFHQDARIVTLSGTSELHNGKIVVWALPLYHPSSPFRSNWKKVLRILAPHLENIDIHIAHNGKYDARWMRRFGVWMRVDFDTMLACHLLDENRLKGLKPQATSRFGVADWGIDTKDLLSENLNEVLLYNAKDTFYTYHIYLETRAELIEQPRLLRVFKFIIMPACEKLIEVERRGIWRDPERCMTNAKIAEDMLRTIEEKLMEYVPKRKKWPVDGKGKTRELNFSPSIWLRWWLFDHLGLPVLERGKAKETAEGEMPGDPSVREAVMLELKGKHPVVELLLERAMWYKYSTAFFPAYLEQADENDRIHTNFKLAGTVTGRLSSGKADEDKVSGRVDNRGVNIQQVPRDPFARGVFGAAPGYTFVEIDFSQVELRVVAFLSRDRTMLRLYRTGEDIHLATASWVLGVPASRVTKEERKKAKAINFGFVYGMYPKKFVATAWEKYELVFSLGEATEIRRLFFEQFSGLPAWHARQRRTVQNFGRVQSPIGRIRHLPDIYSADKFVRMEAERQAINSPVQSFASDMNSFAMVRAIDAFEQQKIKGFALGTVHDASLWEIRTDQLGRALPLLQNTYQDMRPLRKKFGVDIDLPILADIKVGSHWGGAEELSQWEIDNYDNIPF